MILRTPLLRPAAAAALLLAIGCATMGGSFPTAVRRPAEDTPDRFVRADRSPIAGTPGAAACVSPIVDPRSGAQLTMARSSGGRGDYSVAAGRYGVGPGELLRIDCANGSPLGVVGG